jgi:predicted amidohydrolase YtcJ
VAITAVAVTTATGGGRSLVTAGINGLDYAPPDMVLYNGKVATQDAKRTIVQAIALRDGKVLAVGTTDEMKALAGKHTRSVDLGGRTVLPGLLDGHLHGLRNGHHCFTQSPRLDNIYDRQDALTQMSLKAKYVKPGSWVWITSGWNINQFGQRGMFTQAELDKVFPANPVDIRAAGFTGSAANTGVGEEVECPGNTPLVGASLGDTRTPAVADLADDYLKPVTFLAQNHMGLQHHASSKAAQDSELSFWQKANQLYPIKDLRWTIAHPGDDGVSPTPETLAIAKQLGIGMVPGDAGQLGTGTARALVGNIQRAGVHMCLGTDAMNVAPYPPFGDIAYAVTGETEDPSSVGLAVDPRLTRQQALDDETLPCAWQFMQDGRLGQLTPGAHADLIVLDQDYFTVPNHSIHDIRSLLTVVDGRIVWGSPKGPWATLDPCSKAMGGQKWVDQSKNTAAMDMNPCQPTPTPPA